MTQYEAVIGLETHIQLNTSTKIFCSCKADSWGDPPNTNICPVCTGMPGVLPVLNRAVVEKAVMLARAMHAEIRPRGTGYAIVDLGSTNGVRVNGLRVAEQVLIDGDEVLIGNTRMIFEAS